MAELIAGFEEYLAVYDHQVPFQRLGQYEHHRDTVHRVRLLGSATAAIQDDDFRRLLRATLRAWGIGIRGSRLADGPALLKALQAETLEIDALDGLNIDDVGLDEAEVTSRLWGLVSRLAVVDNKAKIVAGTKTLHHLLPDLVVPMDRAWTGRFFGWSALAPQYQQERIFTDAYRQFRRVALAVRPQQYVGQGWRTSKTKVLDNAVIGYCKAHGLG